VVVVVSLLKEEVDPGFVHLLDEGGVCGDLDAGEE
jgi:hypothetical protein